MRMLHLCAFVALLCCAHARSATRTPVISGPITSLTDKDARQKASVHRAFTNAGRQAGIEIWRIENFEPVPVSQKDFGKFYKGDSYIVLKTTSDKRNNLSWDIYYWLGSQTSQDESGAAAILTVGLDDKFNGAAVQHREPMGQESKEFSDLFKPVLSPAEDGDKLFDYPPIRYVDGGVTSGFNHVTTNAVAEKRLIQVKGKKNVRTRQVEPLISSMNKGDVFILDVDQTIMVFVGEKAKNVEKLKAISVANQIRDQDHNGRGKVEIIDQYSSEVDVDKFFKALGSGAKNLVPEESAGGDDQAFEKKQEADVTLFEVSEVGGKVKVTALPKPLKQEQLKPQDAYVLDTVSGSIYVWIGKQATQKEKNEAMNKAKQLVSAKNYGSWVKAERVLQGTEPAIFKQYFATWRDTGMMHNRLVRSAYNGYGNNTDTENSHQMQSETNVSDEDKFFIQYNNVPIGLEVYRDRVFVTVPRRRYGIPSTLNYVSLPSTSPSSPPLKPYPDVELRRSLYSTYRPRVDECGRLWVVDTGVLEAPGARRQIQTPAIVVFDLKTDKQIFRHELSPQVLVNERTSAGLTSLSVEVLDYPRCNDAYAYINDLATEGLVVFSMKTGNSWRVEHSSFAHNESSTNFTIAGNVIPWVDGIFSIALTNQDGRGRRTAFFHPLVSTQEFAVDTDALRRRKRLDNKIRLLGSRGPLSQSGSHAFHATTSTLLFASVVQDGIMCWNTKSKLSPANVALIAQDHEKLVYISDLKIVGDDVWVLANQITNFVYSRLNPDQNNYYIHRGRIQDLIKDTVCDVFH